MAHGVLPEGGGVRSISRLVMQSSHEYGTIMPLDKMAGIPNARTKKRDGDFFAEA